ncbi:MAG: hypothetical protein ACYSU0_05345, partial [Planctomycetota bacterium]
MATVRRIARPGRTCLALVTALAASASALSAEGPDDGKIVRFILNDQQIEGVIVDRNDEGFTLRMDVGGLQTEVRLRWRDLSPSDAERLGGGGKTGGLEGLLFPDADLVRATRYQVRSGRSVVGIEV